MIDPLENVPEQYKQRASYDFIDGRFKVCAGGYGLAECEDSEVAHAICMMWNAALTSVAAAACSMNHPGLHSPDQKCTCTILEACSEHPAGRVPRSDCPVHSTKKVD